MKKITFASFLILLSTFFYSCKNDHKISVDDLDRKSGILVAKMYITSPFEIDSLNLRPEPFDPTAYTDRKSTRLNSSH